MQNLSLTKRILSLAIAASLLSASAVAGAQPTDSSEEGKAHFNAGVTLFRESDYRGALVEFRRAYDLSHNYRVLYNLAQSEYELQDYASALRSFERYLAEGGADIDPERRTSVRADIKRLSSRVAKLEVQSNVAGAEILVDDMVVGKTPLSQPLIVSAGRRKVTVQKAELPPSTRVLELAGGDTASVTLDLATPVAESRPTEAPRPVAVSPRGRSVPWVPLTGTAVLTAGAVVTGIFALESRDDAENKLASRGVTARDVESAHSRAANFALATDILAGAAIGMGILTVILWLQKPSEEPPRTSATLSAFPGGARLGGTF
jgi:hypothetical protein